MSTPTSILSMEKTTPGTNSGWASDVNVSLDTLDRLSAGANMFYVDKAFTAAALGNADAANRRHFDTIQGAITAAEGAGYAYKNVIEIAPDYYDERLVIGKSVTLMGKVPINYYGMGGGRGAEIRGDGTQNPVFTIVPPAGGDISVNLINIVGDNRYADQAVSIAKPYLIDFRSDNAVSLVNYLGINGCVFRGQTWGDDNVWDSLLSLSGFLRTTIERTLLWASDYAGGNTNGGIKNLIKLRGVYTGVPANDKTSWAQVRNCGIYQKYSGPAPAAIFNNDNGSGGRLVRSDLYYNTGSIVIYGATGVNSYVEGTAADILTLGNIMAQTFTL